MSEQAAVGRAIRRLRHERGLSMASLASKAHMSAKHLNLIELGHGNPTLMTLRRLRLALGVTLSEIVLAADDDAARRGEHLLATGERLLTSEEFEEHFGHLPTDGEG